MAETKRMTCEQVVGYLLEGEGLDFLKEGFSGRQPLMEAEVSELMRAGRRRGARTAILKLRRDSYFPSHYGRHPKNVSRTRSSSGQATTDGTLLARQAHRRPANRRAPRERRSHAAGRPTRHRVVTRTHPRRRPHPARTCRPARPPVAQQQGDHHRLPKRPPQRARRTQAASSRLPGREPARRHESVGQGRTAARPTRGHGPLGVVPEHVGPCTGLRRFGQAAAAIGQ